MEAKNYDIEKVLKERDEHYEYPFEARATASHVCKRYLHQYGYGRLNVEEREAIDMICHKLARIITSKKDKRKDSWLDIAGYAMLALESLEK